MECLELVELRADRLGTLEVEHRGQRAVVQAGVERGGVAHDSHRARRVALDRGQPVDHLARVGDRLRLVERLGVVDGERVVRAAERAAREGREQAARQLPLARPREVEVPVATPEELLVVAAGVVQARQHVVVAVEGPHVS